MRQFLAAIFVIVTVSLTAPAWRAFAQAGASDSYESPVCESTRDRRLFTRVESAAFSAEAITVWRPPAGRPELRATQRYYRDAIGRVRVEQTFAGHDSGPQRIIIMPDPATRWTYTLDPAAHTRSRTGNGIAGMMTGAGQCDSFVLPVSMDRFIAFYIYGPQTLYPTLFDDESRPPRLVGGVQALGTRFTMVLPDGLTETGRGERWISPELKLVVASHGEDARIGSIDYQVTKISRAEPSAALFEIPDDYAETSQRPMCWQNPYNVPPRSCGGIAGR